MGEDWALISGVLNAKFLAFSIPNTKKLLSSNVLYVKKKFETSYSNVPTLEWYDPVCYNI